MVKPAALCSTLTFAARSSAGLFAFPWAGTARNRASHGMTWPSAPTQRVLLRMAMFHLPVGLGHRRHVQRLIRCGWRRRVGALGRAVDLPDGRHPIHIAVDRIEEAAAQLVLRVAPGQQLDELA